MSRQHKDDISDPNYAVYEAAFDRLMRGAATHERLQEILEERGFVPVTQDNVAIEAGLTRKALTGAGRFRDLGARIKAERPENGVALTTTKQLKELRAKVESLSQLVAAVRSKLAESVIRADDLELRLMEEQGTAKRLRARLEELGA